MRRTITTVALLAGTVACAQADTWTFRDILRPHGHDRSMAQKRADGRKCGSNGYTFRDETKDQFTACMRRHGWALASVRPDPDERSSSSYDPTFDTPIEPPAIPPPAPLPPPIQYDVTTGQPLP